MDMVIDMDMDMDMVTGDMDIGYVIPPGQGILLAHLALLHTCRGTYIESGHNVLGVPTMSSDLMIGECNHWDCLRPY